MDKDFNIYYVLATKDGASNHLYYYTGKESCHGGHLLSDVLEAKRFTNQNEIIDFLSNHEGLWDLGINIIGIAGVTFEAIKNNPELYKKYHDTLYAIR